MANPASLQRLTRRALLTRAKSDVTLTSLVPASSIEPAEQEPVWPFLLVRSPRTLRLRQSCVRGARVTFDVHAFARAKPDRTAYDHISEIAGAIEGAFADNRLILEDGSVCKIEFSDTQFLPDESPDDWHWIGQINAKVLAEASV